MSRLSHDPRTAKTRARGRLMLQPVHDRRRARWPPHWERHPKGDELLHVLEGEVKVELLQKSGRIARETVRAGSFYVVPRGLWHRPIQREPVVMLYATPSAGTQATFAGEAPSVKRRRSPSTGRRGAPRRR
jgi:mannose-6-phosphate isomerase-like protein (cupin superfamily)